MPSYRSKFPSGIIPLNLEIYLFIHTQNALPRPSTPLSPYQCVQGPVLVFRLQLASFFTVQILTALPIAERLQNSVKQPV